MSSDDEICILEFNTPKGKSWRVIHHCGENTIETSDWANVEEYTDLGVAFLEADRMQKDRETEYGIHRVVMDDLVPTDGTPLLDRLDAYCRQREASELGEDASCSILAHELRSLLDEAGAGSIRTAGRLGATDVIVEELLASVKNRTAALPSHLLKMVDGYETQRKKQKQQGGS
jgi:hypothetical protein